MYHRSGRDAVARCARSAIRTAARSGIGGTPLRIGHSTLGDNLVIAGVLDDCLVGVPLKAVADLLGHSSIAVTGDVYGHTSDTTARTAVDVLADRLGLLDL